MGSCCWHQGLLEKALCVRLLFICSVCLDICLGKDERIALHRNCASGFLEPPVYCWGSVVQVQGRGGTTQAKRLRLVLMFNPWFAGLVFLSNMSLFDGKSHVALLIVYLLKARITMLIYYNQTGAFTTLVCFTFVGDV